MTIPPSEHDLHAYVDGHLDDERRDAVEQYLARHPERAADVLAWQQDAQRLRAALGGMQLLAENHALDPAAIRHRQRQRQRRHASVAAAAVLCLALGGLGGWQARGMQSERSTAPMADAIEAYRLLATDQTAHPDVVPGQDIDMQAWLDARFKRAARLPDLSDAGFRAVGGRLFVTDQGPAAMVLYRNGTGYTISFYVRTPTPRNRRLPTGQRTESGLMAQYWSGQGYNYAMVSHDHGIGPRLMTRARDEAI